MGSFSSLSSGSWSATDAVLTTAHVQVGAFSYRGEASLLAKTPEEFTAGLPDLYLDIALDGMILHDTDEYMTERLEFLRALIRRQGLRCEKDGRDLIWRWEEPPGFDWSLEWEEIP
jgi:hypothetical protein